MQVTGFGDKVAFIWSVPDILPFTVLRRLGCALKRTEAEVLGGDKLVAKNLRTYIAGLSPGRHEDDGRFADMGVRSTPRRSQRLPPPGSTL